MLPYKKNVLSITTDNGIEFIMHKETAKTLNTKIYFTNPYASWQKRAIKNMNKLIRQYLTKDTDFNEIINNNIKNI